MRAHTHVASLLVLTLACRGERAVRLTLHEGVLADAVNGHVWMACPRGQRLDDARCTGVAELVSWSEAQSYCHSLVLAGASNWRIPTFSECASALPSAPPGVRGLEWTGEHLDRGLNVPDVCCVTAINAISRERWDLENDARAAVRCVRDRP